MFSHILWLRIFDETIDLRLNGQIQEVGNQETKLYNVYFQISVFYDSFQLYG